MKSLFENDKLWGSVLIVLGIAAIIFQPFEKFDRWVKGSSNDVMTAMLFILAAGTVAVALYGRPSMKAFWLVWVVTP